MKLSLIILLFPLMVLADPSRESCDFYHELAAEFQCGPKGYLEEFGIPLCEKYLNAESGLHSTQLVEWFREVRFCLQQKLEDERSSFGDCRELKKGALDSHLGCYRETGFCELSWVDRATVLRLTSWRVFTPEVLSLMVRTTKICSPD
jgi:hypothetical protein